jgi:uncharacterized repeat protein (TIGR01451 family)
LPLAVGQVAPPLPVQAQLALAMPAGRGSVTFTWVASTVPLLLTFTVYWIEPPAASAALESAAGGSIQYTVKVSNSGAVDATHVKVTDPLPAGIASASWVCAGNGGATCPTASGNDGLDVDIPTLPVGGSLTYTVDATLAASGLPPSIKNIATVTSNDGVCLGGAAPCSATAINATVAASLGAGGAAAVPALDARVLAALMLLLTGMAAGALRWRGRRG